MRPQAATPGGAAAHALGGGARVGHVDGVAERQCTAQQRASSLRAADVVRSAGRPLAACVAIVVSARAWTFRGGWTAAASPTRAPAVGDGASEGAERQGGPAQAGLRKRLGEGQPANEEVQVGALGAV